ncbi:MAG: nucleotide exchange factor GrpE [Alphaproteobacteria bacterium]
MSDKKNEQTPAGDEAEDGANEPGPEETEAPDAETADAVSGEEALSGWALGELETLRSENADLKDRLLRAAAEMENVRRRTERDKADSVKFAISNFARDVLTIGDNIARAIEHVPADAAEEDPALKSFLEGIQVTERELLNVMERHGIARLNPKGERFDPNKHQAMFEVDNPDVADGTIVEVVQAGYVIAERVLRPALVGIAKGGAKQPKREQVAPAEAPQAANDDTEEPAPKAVKGTKKKASPAAAKKKIGGKIDKNA